MEEHCGATRMQHRRGPTEFPLPAERSLCLPWSATEFHSVDAEDRLICRACGTECLSLTKYISSHITTSFYPGAPSIAPPQRARMRHSTVYVESSVCSTQARPGQGRAAPCIHRATAETFRGRAALSRVFLSAFSLPPVASPRSRAPSILCIITILSSTLI